MLRLVKIVQMTLLFRSVFVFAVLVPWLLRYARDYRAFVLFGPPRRVTEAEHADRARRITHLISRLGPTFIKAVQVLAMRDDLLPGVYTKAFKQLQDRVPPFAARRAYEILEEELGRPVESVFEVFEPEPIAAASLGQVHRAKYQGRWVAVKIRRPGVERIVAADLGAVTLLLQLLGALIDHSILRSLWTAVREFQRVIETEMDFSNEAVHAARLRKNLKVFPRVVIPDCVESLTTERVSVFAFHEGVRVDDVEALRRQGVTPEDLVGLLIEVYVHQTVIDGFVHADPHPGNLLIDREGRLILLDFGMAVEMDPAVKKELLGLTAAVVRNDVDAVVEAFYRLRMVEADLNTAVLRDAARMLMNISFGTEYSPRLIQEVCEDIYRTFHKFPLRLPQSLVYLLRAAALVEGIGMGFDAHFNGARVARPILKRMMRKVAFEGDLSAVEWLTRQGRRARTAVEDFGQILYRAQRDQLRMRLHPADLGYLEGVYQAMMRRIVIGIAGASLAVLGGLIYLRSGSAWLPIACLSVAGVLFFLCVALPLRRPPTLRGSPPGDSP